MDEWDVPLPSWEDLNAHLPREDSDVEQEGVVDDVMASVEPRQEQEQEPADLLIPCADPSALTQRRSRLRLGSGPLNRLEDISEATFEPDERSSVPRRRLSEASLTAPRRRYLRRSGPIPPPRSDSLNLIRSSEGSLRHTSLSQAEKLLGQAFGAPIRETPPSSQPAPKPFEIPADMRFASLRRSFTTPSRPSSPSDVRGPHVSRPATPTQDSDMGIIMPRGHIAHARPSFAAQRSSTDPARSSSQAENLPTLFRNTLRITKRIGSVDTFLSAGLDQDEGMLPAGMLPQAISTTSMGGPNRGTRFDVGRWTVVSGDAPTCDLIEPTGSPIKLERVWSEPAAGPVIRHFEETRVPSFAREPPHDMADAITRAVKIIEEKGKGGVKASKGRDGRFWLAFFAVVVSCFLSAVDLTIIAPILPTIAQEMPKSSISATWITSAFLASSASFQPLFGGLADAIGRRESLLLAILLFLVGSVIVCAARDMATVVAGRGVQGLGCGGMNVVGEVIVSDMTTLAERGYFLGILSVGAAIAAFCAPIAGGWFATFSWRVAFYINFPIGILAMLMLAPAKLNKPTLTPLEKFQRMDVVSSLVLFAGITSLLIGLTNGGVVAPWSAARVTVPMALGSISLTAFFALQFIPNKLSRYPILPAHLFRHRTATIAYALTFLHGIILYGATQGLVLYFQNRGDSPFRAAINILPANIPSTPAAFVAGMLMAITGKYKGQIIISEGLMTLGLGLVISLDLSSPASQWATYQVISSIGLGALYTLTLPPIQATISADDLAHATATFAFARSFGSVWGVSAFLIMFQFHTAGRLATIPGTSEIGLTGATAIDFVAVIGELPEAIRSRVQHVFLDAIILAVTMLTPFSGAGFVLACFIKHVPLPDFNDTKYGLEGQSLGRPSDLQLRGFPPAREKIDDIEAPRMAHTLKRKLSTMQFRRPLGQHFRLESLKNKSMRRPRSQQAMLRSHRRSVSDGNLIQPAMAESIPMSVSLPHTAFRSAASPGISSLSLPPAPKEDELTSSSTWLSHLSTDMASSEAGMYLRRKYKLRNKKSSVEDQPVTSGAGSDPLDRHHLRARCDTHCTDITSNADAAGDREVKTLDGGARSAEIDRSFDSVRSLNQYHDGPPVLPAHASVMADGFLNSPEASLDSVCTNAAPK